MALPSGRKGVNRKEVDRLGNLSSGGSEYTEEEQLIGKWIDGNNLYQKIFTFNTPSPQDTYYDMVNIAEFNIKEIVSCFAVVNTSGTYYTIPYIRTSEYVDFFISLNTGKIRMGQKGFVKKPVTMIIKYTKMSN